MEVKCTPRGSGLLNAPSVPPPLETPGRKRSQPIAIEMPARGTAAYTPLSARGDLPGGYFPNHEENIRNYRPHPFTNHFSSSPDSPMMSPAFSPSSETTPRMPTAFAVPPAFSPAVPDNLRIPRGKYHPSNYKPPASTGAPTATPTPRAAAHPHLSLPLSTSNKRRDRPDRPHHDRKSSEVKRQLQQYQRDMIAQAREAAATMRAKNRERAPISPRLLPLGSPGPITPFALEEADGYIVAGSSELRKENERQIKMLLSKPFDQHGSPVGRA
ncbi:hypothetical protein JHW43_002735 [Diplocarpon mali]|nr:hypothetical protein JHW43_002735 [Diplocarpon mali]